MVVGIHVVIVGPGTVELQRVDLSEDDGGPGDVWIRTLYSLVSAGTEVATFNNRTGGQRYPAQPGYAAVGEVIQEGRQFPNVGKGDVVFTYSGHQQYARARVLCVKLPPNLDPSVGAFARMASISMTALRVCPLELGDAAAVLGQGVVGNLCAQLLQLAGVDTIGIDHWPGRLEAARLSGIRRVINSEAGVSSVREAVMAATQRRGVEGTFDATGNPRAVHLAAQITARFGDIVLLGSPRGSYEGDVTEVLNYVHQWDRGGFTLRGAHELRLPVRSIGGTPASGLGKHSHERNTRIVLELMAADRLRCLPMRTHVISPHGIAEAYRGLAERKDDFIGVMLDWTTM